MHVVDDVRLFVRAWPRMPAFVGTAIIVLALGVGAAAVAFAFLDAILLHRSPIAISIGSSLSGRATPAATAC